MKEKEKTRTDLLNLICEIRKPESYLEIGIQRGVNFAAINCPVKCGVDPYPNEPAHEDVMRMTSNEFFYTKRPDWKFDLIFIDGSHEATQVYEDIINAVQCLKPGGIIVGHDALPATLEHTSDNWCGTSFQAYYSATDPVSYVCTWSGDHGCWIFAPHEGQQIGPFYPVTYEEYKRESTQEFMNVRDWEGVEAWLRNQY